MPFRNLYPEASGAVSSAIMAILHSASNGGMPHGPREWLALILKIIVSAAWGAIIGALIVGTSHENIHLIAAFSGISGWMGTETTILILKRFYKMD